MLALATAGHGTEIVIQILKKLSIYQYFDFVISGLEVKHSKPAPDVYLYVAKQMGFQPNNCIAVEDTVNGVLSGKAAGMKVIGVNKNDEVKNKLFAAKSDFVFNNLNIPDEFWASSLNKNYICA